MTSKSILVGVVAGALALVAGCGSANPSPELVDARRAYERASAGPARETNPRDLHIAHNALERAEEAFQEDPGSTRERDLAYIANRYSMLAEARANQALAQRQAQSAEQQYERQVATQATQAQDELERVNQELSNVRSRLNEQGLELSETTTALREQERQLAARAAEIQHEREQRIHAEEREAAVLERLRELAMVQEDQRGLVITLTGAVLFRSDSAELLPIAEERLGAVALALENYEGHPISIVGHTDSAGPNGTNLRLSRERAEAVRGFLISKGVEPSIIQAIGRGEDEPVADNRSAEGRANNRRVEIVVAGARSGSGAQVQPVNLPTQDRMQNQGMQNQGMQNQGMQNQGMQNQGTQNRGMQNRGMQNQGTQNQGTQNQDIQNQGINNPNRDMQTPGTQDSVNQPSPNSTTGNRNRRRGRTNTTGPGTQTPGTPNTPTPGANTPAAPSPSVPTP